MASSFVDAIDAQAQAAPDAVAFSNSRGERITYAQLRRESDALARWIAANPEIAPKAPVVVYGHKAPLMLVCFLACVKSGHAYVPVDVLYPRERVASIIGQLGETAVLDTVDGIPGLLGGSLQHALFGRETLAGACENACAEGGPEPRAVGQDDNFYILFTSGSTGTPKGVQVTTGCIDRFSAWLQEGAFPAAGHRTWFNRAPFTFDLSVTDLAAGLPHGDTLYALEEEAEKSLAQTFACLAESGATHWVSTPSFLDQCLSDESFDANLIPSLEATVHIGETLRPETARLAKERFPGLRVYNGYGPTESTDFVTLCEVTAEMLACGDPLPVGRVMPGCELAVLDPQTLAPVPTGEHGELFIIGNTVARGYWGRDDLTQAAFHSCPEHIARGRRSYRTGDEMALDASGMLHYHGRLDLQVKLHGFRIELGDIEATLCAMPQVAAACVVPAWRDGVIANLVAFVVPAEAQAPRGFALTKQLKHAAREVIPPYMVPHAFKYLDALPLNANGKADRKALAALLEG